MGNITGYILAVISAVLCLALWVSIIIRIYRNRFGKVRSVNAVVIDKHKSENVTYSKWHSIFPRKNFTVVFEVSEKKMSFDVSEFSYNGYRKGQSGILTYKGNRIIDFKE